MLNHLWPVCRRQQQLRQQATPTHPHRQLSFVMALFCPAGCSWLEEQQAQWPGQQQHPSTESSCCFRSVVLFRLTPRQPTAATLVSVLPGACNIHITDIHTETVLTAHPLSNLLKLPPQLAAQMPAHSLTATHMPAHSTHTVASSGTRATAHTHASTPCTSPPTLPSCAHRCRP